MPEETDKSQLKFPAPTLKKGQHTSATMKAELKRKKTVVLPNGESVQIQAGGIIFNGNIITDPEQVPTDSEIDALNREVLARRIPQ
jgi:mRNA degradation ribonuclease J1/J2